MNRVVSNFAVFFFLWAGVSIAVNSVVDEAVVYVADEIITMDPEHPVATAVAVADGWILGVGSKEDMLELTGAAAVDTRFADKVMVPGLIEQHIHPVLSALTLTTEIISIEDWVLPGRTFPAVRDREVYLSTLSNAEIALTSLWGAICYSNTRLEVTISTMQGNMLSPSRGQKYGPKYGCNWV